MEKLDCGGAVTGMVGYLVAIPALLLILWTLLVRRSQAPPEGLSPKFFEPLDFDLVSDRKVLILTAAVGGGHKAAGRTVRAELERAGCEVVEEDGLWIMSRILGWSLSRGYCSQVRRTPRTLGAIFAVTSRKAGAGFVRFLVGLFCANQLLGLLEKERPDVVISTYPLVTAALGRLRKKGRLRAPVVAVVADYGVHPLWVVPEIDLHLVVSRRSAELAARAGGEAALVRMPVDPAVHAAPSRKETRASLGIPPEAFVALVVGGAWGIGDLEGAARCAVEAGAYTVVVTGENTGLKARLEKKFAGRKDVLVLGWREDLPALMAASDCLIQNAGGMTCIEAIELDLPVIFYDAILGHGELNALVMEQERVAIRAESAGELTSLLRAAVSRKTPLPAPEREPDAPDLTKVVGSLVGSPEPSSAPRWSLRPRPVLASVAALAFFGWSIFATSGAALAAKALDIEMPGYNPAPGKVALAVRTTDPATATAAESLALRERVPLTIFVDARAASGLRAAPGITFGVAEESADKEFSEPLQDRELAQNASMSIRRATGVYPAYFLPAPKTNLAALADAPPHTRLVMAEKSAREPHAGLIVMDASGPGAVRSRLSQEIETVHRRGFECVQPSRL